MITNATPTSNALRGGTHDLPEATSRRWQSLRAGIQNVWEYDDQRFVFHRGRLLLRGRNEAGKSKALEVLLPFLLDGNLSPQRLDPFGSTSRKMRWNLINDSRPDVNVCIGYLWIEFGRRTEQGAQKGAQTEMEYRTIGVGLRARRSTTNVEAWYFTTSQRIDQDLETLGAGRVPLHKAQLIDAIGEFGTVFDKGSDYRRAVNDQLFGMPQDQYDTLIEALLQLRRPQLSKQLQPAELSRILSLSLPPLDGSVVGRLAEGFDRLDRHREEREEWYGALQTVQAFLEVYGRYAKALARARAQAVTEADSAHRRARAALRDAETARDSARTRLEKVAGAIRSLETSEIDLGTRIDTLKSSDAYRAAQELDLAEKNEREAAKSLQSAKQRARDAQEAEQAQREALEKVQCERQGAQDAQQECSRAAGEAARGADLLSVQDVIEQQLGESEITSARGTLASALAERDQSVRAVAVEERESERLRQAWEKSEVRRRESEEEVRLRQERHAAAEQSTNDAADAFAASIHVWADSCSLLALLASEVEELVSVEPEQADEIAHRLAMPRRDRIDELIAQAEVRRREIQIDLDQLRKDRDVLENLGHVAPTEPFWRAARDPSRPGAPLFLLCEFADDVDAGDAANIEAALQSSGLLDAWLTPDGSVLDADTFDVILHPRSASQPSQLAAPERTLADVLRPTPTSDVSHALVVRALRSIALSRDIDESAQLEAAGCSCWVDVHGSWRVGPLQGAWQKERVAFVGETARREARALRLEELNAAVAGRESEIRNVAAELAREQDRREAIRAEVARFPTAQPVRDCATNERLALEELRRAQGRFDETSTAAQKANKAKRDAEAKRDVVANRCGLTRWIGKLDSLRQRTGDYRGAATEVIYASERGLAVGREVQKTKLALNECELRVRRFEQDLEEDQQRATRACSRVASLKESIGKTRTDVLLRLRQLEVERVSVTERLTTSRDEKGEADTAMGATESGVTRSSAIACEREEARGAAEARLQRFAKSGLLPVAGIELHDSSERSDPREWSSRQTVNAARKLQGATSKIEFDENAREKAENRVVERHQELQRGLPGDFRVLSRRSEGALLYEVMVGTEACGLRDLATMLKDDLAARDRLLGDEERKLFESFLSGEAHVHLGDRLRQARSLVDRMNEQLIARPTASGMLLRLQWKVTEDAPTGTEGAINLVLKSSHLLADSERSALQLFLEQRLAEAREDDAPGSLREKMLGVLDYRTWFEFRIEIRDEQGRWKRMTRKTHAAGSGGQKAVMLHLPLFAAAAAFYEAAREGSVRLIMLDEAFAGIDREMRGQLMGLLAEFDLDFLMTSHDEWGFYEELDGLATYHLQRARGIPGVYTDRFLWDGRSAHEMQAR